MRRISVISSISRCWTKIVDAFDVRALLVSSLIGHSLDVFDIELPTVVVLHDLYPFCPALFACFDAPCTQCATDTLKSCMRRNPYNAFWHNTSADDWLSLRQAYAKCLAPAAGEHCRAYAERLGTLDDALSRDCRKTVPDHPPRPRPGGGVSSGGGCLAQPGAGRQTAPCRSGTAVAAQGTGSVCPGLAELVAHAEILLLGCGKFGRPFENTPGVEIVQTYSHQELAHHVEAFRPDAALMLSVVPESFSYTLSEMFALGLPVIATNLGAFAERIEPGRNGLLFEANPAALADLVSKLARDPDVLSAMKKHLRHATTHHVQRHDSGIPCAAACDSGEVAAGSQAVHGRAILRVARGRQQIASDNRHLRHEVDRHAARVATLDADLSESRLRCLRLEQEVARLETEKTEIFRSGRGAGRHRCAYCRRDCVPSGRFSSTNSARLVHERSEIWALRRAAPSVSADVQVRARTTGAVHVASCASRSAFPMHRRVVLSLLPSDRTALMHLVARLASEVSARRNDTVFLLGSALDQESTGVEIETRCWSRRARFVSFPGTKI